MRELPWVLASEDFSNVKESVQEPVEDLSVEFAPDDPPYLRRGTTRIPESRPAEMLPNIALSQLIPPQER